MQSKLFAFDFRIYIQTIAHTHINTDAHAHANIYIYYINTHIEPIIELTRQNLFAINKQITVANFRLTGISYPKCSIDTGN